MTHPQNEPQTFEYPAYTPTYRPAYAAPEPAPTPEPPRKPSRRGWIVAGVLAAVLLAGGAAVGGVALGKSGDTKSEPTSVAQDAVTTTPKTEREVLRDWWNTTVDKDWTDMTNALDGMKTAADANDLASLHQQCALLESSANAVQAKLPAPNQDLSKELAMTVSAYANAGEDCQELTLTSTQAEIEQVGKYVKIGDEHAQIAVVIIGTLK